ncbi:hypothetical protein HZ326_0138 [Fusarium oxysporum f. sp. albedinis]|nr:hypothetical protein HZ326_0138 [Fusarium oxysporum f. sp. albedinis]
MHLQQNQGQGWTDLRTAFKSWIICNRAMLMQSRSYPQATRHWISDLFSDEKFGYLIPAARNRFESSEAPIHHCHSSCSLWNRCVSKQGP